MLSFDSWTHKRKERIEENDNYKAFMPNFTEIINL